MMDWNQANTQEFYSCTRETILKRGYISMEGGDQTRKKNHILANANIDNLKTGIYFNGERGIKLECKHILANANIFFWP